MDYWHNISTHISLFLFIDNVPTNVINGGDFVDIFSIYCTAGVINKLFQWQIILLSQQKLTKLTEKRQTNKSSWRMLMNKKKSFDEHKNCFSTESCQNLFRFYWFYSRFYWFSGFLFSGWIQKHRIFLFIFIIRRIFWLPVVSN